MATAKPATDLIPPNPTARYGHDDACDVEHVPNSIYSPTITSEMELLTLSPTDAEESPIQPSDAQFPIPQLSDGLSTFAYKRALLNRLKEPKLQAGGKCDLAKYTPIFLHDTLMLPGSLANFIGKRSSEDVLRRMTPALLMGHHLHINPQNNSNCPCSLVSSPYPTTYVQGMLLVGQSKTTRDFIHAHYRPLAKRRKLQVEIEIMVLKPLERRLHECDLWEPARRNVLAYVWKISRAIEGCSVEEKGGYCPHWTLEEYLAGLLTPDELPMRIEMNRRGDEDDQGHVLRDDSAGDESEKSQFFDL